MQAEAQRRYFDSGFKREATKLLPGEFFVTDRDGLIVTVLGSCVAACIRDPQAGIGGMNHFMLPSGDAKGDDQGGLPARYGVHAMELLINGLLKRGANRRRLEAKVFGGGNVLRSFAIADVGKRNAWFVRDFLAREEIGVVAEDLEGTWPRKVYYFPKTGRVLVKRLKELHNYTIVSRETAYNRRLVETPLDGGLELFE